MKVLPRKDQLATNIYYINALARAAKLHRPQSVQGRTMDVRSRQTIQALGETTAQGVGWKRGEIVDAFREDGAHTHVKMRLDVAVERPRAGVVGHEPDGHPAIWKHRDCISHWRVFQVERRSVSAGVESPVPIAQDPEVVSVEMPGMNLAVVGIQRVGILNNHIHDAALFEDVHGTTSRGVSVFGRRR